MGARRRAEVARSSAWPRPTSAPASRPPIVENIKFDRGGGDPKNVAIANCAFDRTLAGKNLAEITRARGVEPTIENAAETAIELLTKGGCSAVYHAIGEEDVVRIMRSPYTMIASDGEIPVFGQACAASAQLRHVRARAGRLCAREARAHAGRRRAPHVRATRPSG